MNRIGQGGIATFIDATVSDGAGNLVNADTPPLIDIIDADDVQLATDVVAENTGVGLYRYPLPGYLVPLGGALGTYRIHWTTVINGAAVFSDDYFEVALAGTVTFPTAASWVSGASLASDPRLNDVALPADVTLQQCAESATEYLYKRTGRRFRTTTLTVRPNISNVCGCSIEDCWSNRELSLVGPVAPESLVVVIDGVTLAGSAYALYDGHLLVRQDGGFWPTCSHLAVPDGTSGSWSITYTRGQLPGMDGILACRELAIHVALALSGKPSKLPARATGVQRRGLGLNLLRGLKRTGIPLVDDFVDSVNPNGLMGRPSVMSPDTIRLSSGAPSGSSAETIFDGGGA